MITRLTRAARMAAAACLIGGAASLAGGSSGAGADTFRVAGSWYWANQPPPAPPPVGQPLGNVQPPDVPATDVATAVQNGASEKEAYLHIDTPSVPPPPAARASVPRGGSGAAPPARVEPTPPATGTPSTGSGASPSVTVPVSTSGPGVPTIDQPLAPPANHTGGLPSVAVAPAR